VLTTESVEVFISYHEKDENYCKELMNHLMMLQRNKIITTWHRKQIVAGSELNKEIDQHLNRAGMILLLISSDFIASEYHWQVEVTRALERHTNGKARVILVLLRPVEWNTRPLYDESKKNEGTNTIPLPRDCKPVTQWPNHDQAYLEIVKGIREEVERLTAKLSYSPPKQSTPEAEDREKQSTILVNEADKLLNLFINNSEKLLEHSQFTLLEQRQLEEAVELKEAVAKYRQALQYNPKNTFASLQLAYALICQNKPNEAITALHNAIKMDPNNGAAYARLGAILFVRKNFDKAIHALRKAIQLDPDNAMIYAVLGMSLGQQGKIDEAIALLRKGIQIDPNNPFLYFNLALALRGQGKLDEAIAALRQTIQLDPDNANYRNLLETFLKAQEQKKKKFLGLF
jgi:tetratricopeptide (TPR) repeat protein